MEEDNKTPAKSTESKGKKIEVSETDLKELIEQNKALVDENKGLNERITAIETGVPPVLQKVKERTCRLRVVDGKVVLGWTDKKVYSEYSKDRREDMLYIDLLLQGASKPKKMEYLNFLNNSERIIVKIIKVDDEPIEKVDSFVNKKEYNGDFGMNETDVRVPVEVNSVHKTYTVELPDGSHEEIDEEFINA